MDLSMDTDPNSPTYRDLLVVSGDLVPTSDANPQGTSYVKQSILRRMRMFQGEWFLNLDLGVPWFQQILIKGANRALIDAIFQDVILKTPGVKTLLEYEGTYSSVGRLLTIKFRAASADGIIAYDGPLNTPTDMVVS